MGHWMAYCSGYRDLLSFPVVPDGRFKLARKYWVRVAGSDQNNTVEIMG